MRSEEINLAGAGGQAPGSVQAEGATASSPIYLLEEVRKVARNLFLADGKKFEELANKVYEIAREYHDRFCNYPCFVPSDVEAFLILSPDEAFVIEDQGTTIITKAGAFGNLSYSHFLDSVYYAVEEIRKEATILVKVVQAHNINLHLKNLDTGKSTKITAADELVLVKSLVDYVVENGKQSTRKQWGYSRIAHSRVKYTNKVYTLLMNENEVLSLLEVTLRNRRCFTLQRILEVLGLEVEKE